MGNEVLKKYDIYSEEVRSRFLSLGTVFLSSAYIAISEGDTEELDYIVYHLYNTDETCQTYLEFVQFIRDFYNEANKKDYPVLVDNLSNFLIVLNEPEANQFNQGYIVQNNAIWKEIVQNDDVLKNNSHFRKYLF